MRRVSEAFDKLFSPARLGGLALRNRVIRTACFEGMSPGGAPSDALVEHHRRIAAGGTAMTTLAYCSVSKDGRTFDNQILMDEAVEASLSRLAAAVHAEGGAVAIQLGHSGDFSSRAATGSTPVGPSRRFNLYGLAWARAMEEDDLTRVAGDFGRAAAIAVRAGVDAIELHAGHGYLLSQFLSGHTNRRADRYGGPLENRLRFPLEVLAAARGAVGASTPILVKMNLCDAVRGGLTVDEAVPAARAFEGGGASALVLSGGFVSARSCLYMLRGGVPTREMARAQPGVLRKIGLNLFGRLFVARTPYEELFFLEDALRIRAAVGIPLVLLGGVASRAGMERAIASGFDFVALGRALIRDPDFTDKVRRGEIDASDCDHCNRCVAEMAGGGVRCVCLSDQNP
jgi:2,4-dienoyl-CoA reductase-like NADH-dependent reductase (Old Yellow Enzyme family)